MSDIESNKKEELTGFDALHDRLRTLAEEEEGDALPAKEEEKVEEKEEEKSEPQAVAEQPMPEKEEEKAEEVAEAEPKAEPEVNAYKPTYQYKFQDKMFDFDDRVKTAIKTEKDEEYFRDLYTKSAAMELMKTRSEETLGKYQVLESEHAVVRSKSEENDKIVNYWSGLLEGINKGDTNAFNQLLSLANVDHNTLARLGEAMAYHLENPDQYSIKQQKNVQDYQKKQYEQQTSKLTQQQEHLEIQQTDFEIKRSLLDPEIADVAKFVDEKWGKGSFENMVWSEGSAIQAQNQNVSLNDVPKIVRSVADKFKTFLPAPSANTVSPRIVEQRVVKNTTTHTLPNVSGEQGVPVQTAYKEGSGLDGLRARHKALTGSEL